MSKPAAVKNFLRTRLEALFNNDFLSFIFPKIPRLMLPAAIIACPPAFINPNAFSKSNARLMLESLLLADK